MPQDIIASTQALKDFENLLDKEKLREFAVLMGKINIFLGKLTYSETRFFQEYMQKTFND